MHSAFRSSSAESLCKGQLVLTDGAAGIGKSRLTSELKAQIDPDFVRIYEGKSLTYRKSISYWIFMDLLRNYLGVTEETPEETVEEKLRERVFALLGANASKTFPYLRRLLSAVL